MDLWRVSRFSDLSGQGGLRYSGRWHTAGRPIVYMAESLAGALLETIVHLQVEDDEIPRGLLALRISVSSEAQIEDIAQPARDWKVDLALTQSIGDAWLTRSAAALARVPSALLPHTHNVLFNPLHIEAATIRVHEAESLDFDPRLLPRVRRIT